MKKEYNIKDRVWIHLGERKLVEGRVVDIIDLEHLKEGHSSERELYIIELKTGIDDVYEVRDFDQISPDAQGPINLFRKIKNDVLKNQRYLNKVGVQLPVDRPNPLQEIVEELNSDLDDDEPTADQIHAALASAAEAPKVTIFRPEPAKKPNKKRTFTKRKKPNVKASDNT